MIILYIRFHLVFLKILFKSLHISLSNGDFFFHFNAEYYMDNMTLENLFKRSIQAFHNIGNKDWYFGTEHSIPPIVGTGRVNFRYNFSNFTYNTRYIKYNFYIEISLVRRVQTKTGTWPRLVERNRGRDFSFFFSQQPISGGRLIHAPGILATQYKRTRTHGRMHIFSLARRAHARIMHETKNRPKEGTAYPLPPRPSRSHKYTGPRRAGYTAVSLTTPPILGYDSSRSADVRISSGLNKVTLSLSRRYHNRRRIVCPHFDLPACLYKRELQLRTSSIAYLFIYIFAFSFLRSWNSCKEKRNDING